MHLGALTTYSSTEHFRRLLSIYLDADLSVKAALRIMRDRTQRMMSIGGKLASQHLQARDTDRLQALCARFDTAMAGCRTVATLLGHEGDYSKGCYREFGRLAGLQAFKRNAGAGPPDPTAPRDAEAERIALANRLIDHGNDLCYGMAGAALWALGIPPHMSVFHGKTRAGGLVFDLADSFKDALVLPLAFSVATRKKADDPEKLFRALIIEAFDDHKILAKAVDSVDAMLSAAEPDGPRGE